MSIKDRNMVAEPVLNAGIPTFMHAPYVPPRKEDLRKYKPGFAVLGTPLEGAPSVGLPGASLGPRVIRLGSESVISYNAEFDIDFNEFYSIVDCGDVQPFVCDVVATHNKIESVVSGILEAGLFPIVLGGDDSVPIPCVRAFHKHVKGRIGIIHFDSHLDTWDEITGFKYSNCSHISRAVELERVRGRNVVQIGIRGDLNDILAHRNAERAGIKTFYRHVIYERGIRDVTKEALEIASDGTEAVYLTFDIDCLDGAHAPATSNPGIGALSTIEAIDAMRTIAKSGVVKFIDLVEVGSMAADPNNLTGRAAATILVEFMNAMTLSKREPVPVAVPAR